MTQRDFAAQSSTPPIVQHVAVAGPSPARLALIDVGPVDAPPLLFLHGVGGLHGQWDAQLPAFAARHRCLAPDMRGHGLSEATHGSYSTDRLRGDIEQLLVLRGITQPISIVAHSYGGVLALDLALQHPELVRSLVLIALAERMNFGALFRVVATFPVPNPPLDLLRRIFFADRFHADVRVLRAVMRQAILPWHGWQKLKHIPQPVLLVAGQHDVVAPPHAMRAFARCFAHAQVAVMRGARHKVQLQQPDAVNARIATFLKDEG